MSVEYQTRMIGNRIYQGFSDDLDELEKQEQLREMRAADRMNKGPHVVVGKDYVFTDLSFPYRTRKKKEKRIMPVRHFELTEDGHNKFWEIDESPKRHQGYWTITVAWGKIGTVPTHKTHEFDSDWDANEFIRIKTTEKRRKGYQEKSRSDATALPARLSQIWYDKDTGKDIMDPVGAVRNRTSNITTKKPAKVEKEGIDIIDFDLVDVPTPKKTKVKK